MSGHVGLQSLQRLFIQMCRPVSSASSPEGRERQPGSTSDGCVKPCYRSSIQAYLSPINLRVFENIFIRNCDIFVGQRTRAPKQCLEIVFNPLESLYREERPLSPAATAPGCRLYVALSWSSRLTPGTQIARSSGGSKGALSAGTCRQTRSGGGTE